MRGHPRCFAAWLLVQLAIGTAPLAADEVDEYVRNELARENIPGLSIAVVRNGKALKLQSYGFANLEHRVAVTPDTMFQSGSIGKQFLATLIMMLAAEAKLDLEDKIGEHIDGAPPAWRDITICHLLSHTSGIPDEQYFQKIDRRRDYSEQELLREIAALPLEFAPGERWNYSNPGYVLLGILVREVTGRFYADVLHDRIFEPAGMTTVRVISEADIVPNRAAGYRLVDGELKNQEWVAPMLNTTADGSLYLTIRDLIAWDAALADETLLDRRALERMWTPIRLNDGNTAPYGFGWRIENVNGHRVVEHSGHWQGFSSYITRYVDKNLSVIVLANRARWEPADTTHTIAAFYDPELAPVSHHGASP